MERYLKGLRSITSPWVLFLYPLGRSPPAVFRCKEIMDIIHYADSGWSIIPPLLAVALAILTRRVLLSLGWA